MLEDVCDGTSDISDVLVSKRHKVRGHHSRGLAIFGLDMRKLCVRNPLAEGGHLLGRGEGAADRRGRNACPARDIADCWLAGQALIHGQSDSSSAAAFQRVARPYGLDSAF